MANNQQGGSGNFANDREKASEAGRKGGQSTQQHSQSSGNMGQQGGSGNFAQNPERAAEAGRKGGQSVPDEKRSFSQDHLASEAGRKGGQS